MEGGAPSLEKRTALLGMTKTPTLRVSADMLVSQSRACALPSLWPSLGFWGGQDQEGETVEGGGKRRVKESRGGEGVSGLNESRDW